MQIPNTDEIHSFISRHITASQSDTCTLLTLETSNSLSIVKRLNSTETYHHRKLRVCVKRHPIYPIDSRTGAKVKNHFSLQQDSWIPQSSQLLQLQNREEFQIE